MEEGRQRGAFSSFLLEGFEHIKGPRGRGCWTDMSLEDGFKVSVGFSRRM